MRSALSIGLALLLVGGCGFHLRTYDLQGSVATASVTGSNRNPLTEPLKRALRGAGVTVVDSAQDADLRIDLLNERSSRRSVSVTSQARAAEYETTLAIQYAVRSGSEQMLIEPRWVQTSRVFQVDRDNLVGASEEQSLLEREMVNDLIGQVIRSLNAASEGGAT